MPREGRGILAVEVEKGKRKTPTTDSSLSLFTHVDELVVRVASVGSGAAEREFGSGFGSGVVWKACEKDVC